MIGVSIYVKIYHIFFPNGFSLTTTSILKELKLDNYKQLFYCDEFFKKILTTFDMCQHLLDDVSLIC